MKYYAYACKYVPSAVWYVHIHPFLAVRVDSFLSRCRMLFRRSIYTHFRSQTSHSRAKEWAKNDIFCGCWVRPKKQCSHWENNHTFPAVQPLRHLFKNYFVQMAFANALTALHPFEQNNKVLSVWTKIICSAPDYPGGPFLCYNRLICLSFLANFINEIMSSSLWRFFLSRAKLGLS